LTTARGDRTKREDGVGTHARLLASAGPLRAKRRHQGSALSRSAKRHGATRWTHFHERSLPAAMGTIHHGPVFVEIAEPIVQGDGKRIGKPSRGLESRIVEIG